MLSSHYYKFSPYFLGVLICFVPVYVCVRAYVVRVCAREDDARPHSSVAAVAGNCGGNGIKPKLCAPRPFSRLSVGLGKND